MIDSVWFVTDLVRVVPLIARFRIVNKASFRSGIWEGSVVNVMLLLFLRYCERRLGYISSCKNS